VLLLLVVSPALLSASDCSSRFERESLTQQTEKKETQLARVWRLGASSNKKIPPHTSATVNTSLFIRKIEQPATSNVLSAPFPATSSSSQSQRSFSGTPIPRGGVEMAVSNSMIKRFLLRFVMHFQFNPQRQRSYYGY
jgi:hypothetical protein